MPDLSTLSPVDIAAVAMVVAGAVVGLFRGLSGEISRLISTLVAFILGIRLCHPVGLWLSAHTRISGPAAATLAFCLTLIAAIVVMLVIRLVLKQIFQLAVTPAWERIGGLLAGSVRAAVFVVILFWIFNLVPHDYLNRLFGEESVVGTQVRTLIPHIQLAVESVQGDPADPSDPSP
ncbi:MAG: hypothetical protein A2498_07775 [Lentisphaerae bacterium RIFOXYC12_FULL_60_16]|nr:MAG: hypothetical protein A2498_07775 [Lentisphaerae bacterium RIFOXYC12_FULL_60_16]OGV73843.1 MAG: hypothetical protein A2269_04060 [Lentisphaerae bacterium RIFOXYA12_FULL_60_10]OGV83512.1 MAG: hypothetical protein A2340_10385 [Lentisphaerae bacterium RIFOXYB12_FULL_60_10]